jgi:hypothetical protein
MKESFVITTYDYVGQAGIRELVDKPGKYSDKGNKAILSR